MNTAIGQLPDACTIESLTSDKGYYKVTELVRLQHYGVKTIISDPIDNRRLDKLSTEERAAVRAAKRSSTAKYGKELLRRRGQHIERSFEHVLDEGGARRTTLRGRENITKRYLIQALSYNLSLLMRTLLGVGTPKQALAMAFSSLEGRVLALLSLLTTLVVQTAPRRQFRTA
jgi:transposase